MFAEKFKELRESLDINKKNMAKFLNVGPSTVSMWEQDKRTPDKEMLVRIADFFDVSIDYLFGRTNIKNDNEVILKMSTFAQRFKELRLEKNKTQKELATYFNKSDALISKYENGKAVPEFNFLIELSDFFGVSIDYLVGKNDSNNSFKNTEFIDLINNINNFEPEIEIILQKDTLLLTPKEIQSIFIYLDFLGVNIKRINQTLKTKKVTKDSAAQEIAIVIRELAANFDRHK